MLHSDIRLFPAWQVTKANNLVFLVGRMHSNSKIFEHTLCLKQVSKVCE